MKLILALAFGLSTTILLLPSSARSQCTQFQTPAGGTTFSNNNIGGIDWAGPANAMTKDGSFATVTATPLPTMTLFTNYLVATGFGFTIPGGGSICGVNVQVTREQSVGAGMVTVVDKSVKLVVGGAVSGADQANSNPWTATNTDIFYGGSNYLWGLALTPAIINAADFGVAISANMTAGILLNPCTIGVDYMLVSVTYSNTPLLITLESFSAHRQQNANVLDWTATFDDQAESFIVQRSGDGKTWNNMDTIPVQRGQEQYSYTDNDPMNGPDYYRLYLLNKDGKGNYSVIQVLSQVAMGVRVYPNPVTNTINISSPQTLHSISIKDMDGRTILTQVLSAPSNTAQIPAAQLPAGMYFLQVDGNVFKFIKQ